MDWVRTLPHVNALLNLLATVLLITGLRLIKRGKEDAHRRVMLASFGVSTLFLVSYLAYHFQVASVKFPSYPGPWVRTFYYGILASHVVLAMTVPFLAITTIYLGLRGRRSAHRRLARWTFPIWLYVSITGVVVYLMLYQIYPPRGEGARMPRVSISGEIAAHRWD